MPYSCIHVASGRQSVNWPLFRGRIKVISTISLHSTLSISETLRYRLGSKGPPIGNGIWAIKLLHDPKGQTREWPQYSRKRLEIETPFERTTNRKWPLGVSNGHVTDDVTWPRKVLWGSTVGCLSDSFLFILLIKTNNFFHWFMVCKMVNGFQSGVLVAQWLGRRTSDPAVLGSIPRPRVIRHLGQLSLPSLRGR